MVFKAYLFHRVDSSEAGPGAKFFSFFESSEAQLVSPSLARHPAELGEACLGCRTVDRETRWSAGLIASPEMDVWNVSGAMSK